jgi:peptidoglycan/xylan/chitin deacetylase (PgdA/CDA1 family)
MQQRLVRGVLKRMARYIPSKPLVMNHTMPLVSFTFDDVPETAYTNGASILEHHGVRGTFYIAAGKCGTIDTDSNWRVIDHNQVRALYDQGHEIGCHTFSHARVDMLDAGAMEEECRRNEVALKEICPDIDLTNFCYPYGQVSLPRKLQLQKRFASCRGCFEGINAGIVDLGLLSVVELYESKLTPDGVRRLVQKARDRNGWLILYTHDVAETPSWIGCSPELLRAAIVAAQEAKIPCLTIREALTAIGYSRSNPGGIGAIAPGASR